MKFWTSIKWRKLLRSLHRDLGYFFVGLTCIYAVSGLILNYKIEGKDPAFKEVITNKKLDRHISVSALKKNWKLWLPDAPKCTRVIPIKKLFRIYVKGGLGEYNPQTGKLTLTVYKEKPIIKFINNIHYNQGKRFTWLANFFAISMLFFAISGIIIVKGKMGFKKRGVWIMIGGILVPLLVYFLF